MKAHSEMIPRTKIRRINPQVMLKPSSGCAVLVTVAAVEVVGGCSIGTKSSDLEELVYTVPSRHIIFGFIGDDGDRGLGEGHKCG